MARTKISWAEFSWNPIAGCTKVSPGCAKCYAERMAVRQGWMEYGRFKKNSDAYEITCGFSEGTYSQVVGKKEWNGKVVCIESALDKPLHWKKSRRIFVNSMGDTFHESVPFEFIVKMFEVMANAGQHTYQILTKRPERMRAFFQSCEDWDPTEWPNVHLGVSAENQEWADKRVPHLLATPAAKRFVSLEPLLGPIKLWEQLPSGAMLCPGPIATGRGIDQVIVGAESIGAHAGRECKLEWVRDIVQQCQAAGVKVRVKQLHIDGKLVKDINQFPEDLRIREEI